MKKIIISSVLAFLTIFPSLIGYADNTSYLPVVERNGEQCYYYAADKGESVYGITEKFGWDPSVFMQYNPNAVDIKSGQIFYYPCKSVVTVDNDTVNTDRGQSTPGIGTSKIENKAKDLKTEYYEVGDGETILDIAHKNHMSVSQLMMTNPGLTLDNLSAGERLKVIPGADMMRAELRDVKEYILTGQKSYKIKNNDTWQSIAVKNKLDTLQLQQANPDVKHLTKGQKIIIPQFRDTIVTKWQPVVDMRENTAGGIKEIYDQTHKRLKQKTELNTPTTLNVAILVSCDDAVGRRRDLEFLKGFMLGMQGKDFKKCDINLKGIDLADYGNLSKTLQSGVLDNADMVICSVDRDFPLELVQHCDLNDIMLFNVFDAKTDISTMSRNAVQLLPPSSYFYDRTADFLTRIMNDRVFLFVDAVNDDPESMCGAVRTRLQNVPQADIIDLTDAGALAAFAFNPAKSYTVISDAGSKEEITATLKVLEELVNKYPNMPLSIVGRANWIVYGTAMESLFRKLDTYIPSRFLYEETPQTRDFNSRFRNFYDAMPLNTLPGYSLMGYDVADYFLPQYIETEGDLNQATPGEGQLQIEFRPDRVSMYDGFMNKRVYLLHYTPFATTEKISL